VISVLPLFCFVDVFEIDLNKKKNARNYVKPLRKWPKEEIPQ
jgi:hypothetical protein